VILLAFQSSVIVSAVRPPPYWPKYGGDRHVELIDGLWSTAKLGSIEDPPVSFDSMDPDFYKTPNFTSVPSCVDDRPPGYLGYRGVSSF
jgi:hypothetical protein